MPRNKGTTKHSKHHPPRYVRGNWRRTYFNFKNKQVQKRLDAKLIRTINLMFLLKSGPKTWKEMYKSGVFITQNQLHFTIKYCKEVGLIILDHLEYSKYDINIGRRRFCNWWVITSLGMNFLRFYDNKSHQWQLGRYRKVTCE